MPTPQQDHRVLCVGDMVADFFASPMPRLPESGEMLLTDTIAVFTGGNALNTAVALRRLGESVAIVGDIADDPIGDLVLAQLEGLGLNATGVQRVPDGVTPATLIYRGEGEDRRFIHALGVAADFTGENVPGDLIPEGGILFIGGYLKLSAWNDDALAETMRQAQRRGCTVVLNVSISREGDVDTSRCLRLLPLVDVFVPNEDEARILTGEEALPAQARALRDAGACTAVITRGGEGLYADDGEQSVAMGVFSVPLVDPAGCGDCFTAGLIAGLLQEWDLPRTLEFASAVGALGATALGCTSGVPPAEEVTRFLQENDIATSVSPSSAS
jgi:sugar/nucleoside kinase (ribokinase family)